MINVFEGLIRQDVLDGKGGFEKILSEVEQTGSKADDNKTFQTREGERPLPTLLLNLALIIKCCWVFILRIH